MRTLNSELFSKKEREIKVLQFGEGNFLRAFVDYMIDIMNEQGDFDGNIVLVKPIQFGSLEQFEKQDCNYTVLLRGIEDGNEKVVKRVVTSVADTVDSYSNYSKYIDYAKLPSLRYIVSNTTEAGIVYDESDSIELCPPKSYPGKLTQFLYERFKAFDGAADKGLVMLPVELIDDNGIMLKKCVLKQIENWKLPDAFKAWVEEACIFTSTLVDRIVTGYPKLEDKKLWEEFGYEDRLLVTGEPFALWVIESDKDISGELPFVKAGLPVIYTDNQKPYKQRKVRILNGAHTSFVLASYMAGNDTVLESMDDGLISRFMTDTIYDEIIPTLDLPKEDLMSFAGAVKSRFGNPYVRHELLSISLNSVSKWRARCMPSLLGYVERYGNLPVHLTFSIAALMYFYSSSERDENALIGKRNDNTYRILDDAAVLDFFAANSGKNSEEFVNSFLSSEEFFGQNLLEVEELGERVAEYLDVIRKEGMRKAIELCC